MRELQTDENEIRKPSIPSWLLFIILGGKEDKNKYKALPSQGLMLQIALSVDPRVKNLHSTQATERFQICTSLMKLNVPPDGR